MPQRTKPPYIPISPLFLGRDFKGAFDIFIKHDDNYVLFNAWGRELPKDKREDLSDHDVRTIYIHERDRERYRKFLSENVADLLRDESIPINDRAMAWSNSAVFLGKELFEINLPGPTFEKRYKRFEILIERTSGFLQSPQSLKHLAQFISKGYAIYHHGISTMVYAVNLMREFEYEAFDILACGMGALLHDIGKTGLPPEIIKSDPETLSSDDRTILSLHPIIGVRVCSSFNLPILGSNCILFHHERADGRGYPTQATAEQLPPPIKMVALCDRYDNLTRNQHHRKGLPPYEALKVIMEDKGLAEPEILKKFIEMLSRAEIV